MTKARKIQPIVPVHDGYGKRKLCERLTRQKQMEPRGKIAASHDQESTPTTRKEEASPSPNLNLNMVNFTTYIVELQNITSESPGTRKHVLSRQ
ncbi:hypothetical protein TNIN_41731 [Trichonephila inaurata madagascariensis]|uniref:Uncharacterized protein n=1 Tax=Trichonephila inaurata madagascariensis TaxID=2747483 RepID=A0A8X6I9T6_9ARAC|nr:hypothetical protein TNIN_41731 [Trichonephila inaurata madagascariensis]